MKHIRDFTIKEFYEYKDALDADDIFGVFELFGLDATKMPFDVYEKRLKEIRAMHLPNKNEGVKKVYKLNGTRYKANLNHLKLLAGQFIDFQSYMGQKDFDLANALSVFLIPQQRKFLRWTTPKYNSGYDMEKVQSDIRNYMKIIDANNLKAFFLESSLLSLQTSKAFLEKKKYKMMMKKEKAQRKQQQGTLG